jgi:hypothetical protein
VAESLDTQVLRADFEVECPGCEYPLWVTGAEVIAQAAVTCPCCRVRVRLVDAGGTLQNVGRDVERQFKKH